MLEPIIALSVFLTFRVQSEAAAPIIYRVIEIQSSAPTINYRQLKSSTRIDFKGTDLLAEAKGSAEVKIKAGATEIDAEFKNLPAATLFGPECLT
ncbi:MAG: hypothetical protein NTX64_00440, partial [Elusimicrobia bacterium]|nr:hypothetical protein [Elusimicrobiota bacterium]